MIQDGRRSHAGYGPASRTSPSAPNPCRLGAVANDLSRQTISFGLRMCSTARPVTCTAWFPSTCSPPRPGGCRAVAGRRPTKTCRAVGARMSISAVWLSPHNRARVRGPGPRPRALREHTGMRVQVLRSQPRADSTVGDEAKDNPLRFTTDIVRFTRPVCNGVAGVAPDPQSRAGEWAGLVDSWAQSNQDWVKGRQVAWILIRSTCPTRCCSGRR